MHHYFIVKCRAHCLPIEWFACKSSKICDKTNRVPLLKSTRIARKGFDASSSQTEGTVPSSTASYASKYRINRKQKGSKPHRPIPGQSRWKHLRQLIGYSIFGLATTPPMPILFCNNAALLHEQYITAHRRMSSNTYRFICAHTHRDSRYVLCSVCGDDDAALAQQNKAGKFLYCKIIIEECKYENPFYSPCANVANVEWQWPRLCTMIHTMAVCMFWQKRKKPFVKISMGSRIMYCQYPINILYTQHTQILHCLRWQIVCQVFLVIDIN